MSLIRFESREKVEELVTEGDKAICTLFLTLALRAETISIFFGSPQTWLILITTTAWDLRNLEKVSEELNLLHIWMILDRGAKGR